MIYEHDLSYPTKMYYICFICVIQYLGTEIMTACIKYSTPFYFCEGWFRERLHCVEIFLSSWTTAQSVISDFHVLIPNGKHLRKKNNKWEHLFTPPHSFKLLHYFMYITIHFASVATRYDKECKRRGLGFREKQIARYSLWSSTPIYLRCIIY